MRWCGKLDRGDFAVQSSLNSLNFMKTLARVGAVASFSFFLLPGAWVLNQRSGSDGLAFVIGFTLLGIAFFAGTLLWLIGERFSSKPHGD